MREHCGSDTDSDSVQHLAANASVAMPIARLEFNALAGGVIREREQIFYIQHGCQTVGHVLFCYFRQLAF